MVEAIAENQPSEESQGPKPERSDSGELEETKTQTINHQADIFDDDMRLMASTKTLESSTNDNLLLNKKDSIQIHQKRRLFKNSDSQLLSTDSTGLLPKSIQGDYNQSMQQDKLGSDEEKKNQVLYGGMTKHEKQRID